MLKGLLRAGDRVLHVGAHHAEEKELYDAFGCRRVVWVEADPAMHPRLRSLLKPPHCLVEAAASDCAGVATLHRFTVSGANSILPRGRVQEMTFSGEPVAQVDEVQVPTLTVDSLDEEFDVVALDVQGAEAKVLRGARRTLKGVRAVYLELLHDEYYAGQATLTELWPLLEGFVLAGVEQEGPGWSNAAFIRYCQSVPAT